LAVKANVRKNAGIKIGDSMHVNLTFLDF
jgi:hypothetical protein